MDNMKSKAIDAISLLIVLCLIFYLCAEQKCSCDGKYVTANAFIWSGHYNEICDAQQWDENK